MKHSTDRILTTHVGSLVRPPEIVAMTRGREQGKPFSEAELATLKTAVACNVKMQADCGIDIPSDGEYGKSSFANYITDRLSGFEIRPNELGLGGSVRGRDRKRFAEAYLEIDGPAGGGGAAVCTGPIEYRGQAFVQTDVDNFKAAMQGLDFAEAFIPAVGPGTIELQRRNEYYKTQEEYLYAIATAMRTEYRMITEAGFILQIDDPRIMTEYDSSDPQPAIDDYRKFAQLRVEATNHAIEGIPEDRIRYHVCWGSWHGPHTTDIELKDIADVILGIKASAFSIEAANPRHAHEYHLWERTKFPEGKVIIPGVIAHTTNCVEHPELVADRLLTYARLVGRENVVAGADCGFAQNAPTQRVHPSIMWEKFRMLAEGARIASARLWA